MRQSSRRPTIPQDQLGRMASAAMEWSISPQEKKFQKYIQTFLPYYMKNGDPNPVQSLKRNFMKDDCSKGKACQDGLFISSSGDFTTNKTEEKESISKVCG